MFNSVILSIFLSQPTVLETILELVIKSLDLGHICSKYFWWFWSLFLAFQVKWKITFCVLDCPPLCNLKSCKHMQ